MAVKVTPTEGKTLINGAKAVGRWLFGWTEHSGGRTIERVAADGAVTKKLEGVTQRFIPGLIRPTTVIPTGVGVYAWNKYSSKQKTIIKSGLESSGVPKEQLDVVMETFEGKGGTGDHVIPAFNKFKKDNKITLDGRRMLTPEELLKWEAFSRDYVTENNPQLTKPPGEGFDLTKWFQDLTKDMGMGHILGAAAGGLLTWKVLDGGFLLGAAGTVAGLFLVGPMLNPLFKSKETQITKTDDKDKAKDGKEKTPGTSLLTTPAKDSAVTVAPATEKKDAPLSVITEVAQGTLLAPSTTPTPVANNNPRQTPFKPTGNGAAV